MSVSEIAFEFSLSLKNKLIDRFGSKLMGAYGQLIENYTDGALSEGEVEAEHFKLASAYAELIFQVREGSPQITLPQSLRSPRPNNLGPIEREFGRAIEKKGTSSLVSFWRRSVSVLEEEGKRLGPVFDGNPTAREILFSILQPMGFTGPKKRQGEVYKFMAKIDDWQIDASYRPPDSKTAIDRFDLSFDLKRQSGSEVELNGLNPAMIAPWIGHHNLVKAHNFNEASPITNPYALWMGNKIFAETIGIFIDLLRLDQRF